MFSWYENETYSENEDLGFSCSYYENEDLGSSFSYYENKDPSKQNCSLFNENFPAEKGYRLLESIFATRYSGHELFIARNQEAVPIQNAFFVILSRNPNYKSKAASF